MLPGSSPFQPAALYECLVPAEIEQGHFGDPEYVFETLQGRAADETLPPLYQVDEIH
ncbi:hypothetical protein ACP_3215 [Acidobacterium capsulatum ATCC 51196]|uniref:Uncharacterized protein n=1 Tax=Acidobacterium capsulatum (strain ATCC 51196 / DSM 11244 / BCRC 80197 / JCM 7670 / NBRC 15755 / NCIMB 13165 / 161) TaxID=240015 RepID=C1F5N5_ACIC5|nr:hypothetical protein ACP_3215 [Acidobacterium capsulatum ATCC 51196]